MADQSKQMGAPFDFLTPPYSVYVASHNIRLEMQDGGDLEDIRERYAAHSGLPLETINIIIETIQSEKAGSAK